jgi:hypothetical protein
MKEKGIKMKRQFIASVLAVSIAFTGLSTAPAKAGNEMEQFLFGVTALMILGADMNGQNQGQAVTTKNKHKKGPKVVHYKPNKKKAHKPKRNMKKMPWECVAKRRLHGRSGPRLIKANCAWNNVRRPNLLPNRCMVTKHTRRGFRDFYVAPCMRRAGWS